MEIGDKFIVNPDIPINTSDNNIIFYDYLRVPGFLSVRSFNDVAVFMSNNFWYSPRWLIPEHPLKVGDKIKIRNNIKAGDTRIPFGVCNNMLQYAGNKATIEEVHSGCCTSFYGCVSDYYTIDLDGGRWSWPLCLFDLSIFYKNYLYENRLQEQEISVSGTDREDRIAVCSRKHRARIERFTPSYKEVIGRG